MIRTIRLHYAGSRPTGLGGRLLSFLPACGIRFTAGQPGLRLFLGGGGRPFSITSAFGDEQIEFATFLHDASRTKSALGALRLGDAVRFLGPLGHLAPPPMPPTCSLADRASYPEDREAFADQLAGSAADQLDAHFLIAGSRAFVRDTARRLRDAGIAARQTRRDPFYGAAEHATHLSRSARS